MLERGTSGQGDGLVEEREECATFIYVFMSPGILLSSRRPFVQMSSNTSVEEPKASAVAEGVEKREGKGIRGGCESRCYSYHVVECIVPAI